YLPASKKQPEKPPITISTSPEMSGKRVLIMDDEENICALVKAILERYGLQVESAVNGEDAIRKFITAKQLGMPFDLVILDLTIHGGIGGKEVVVELKKYDPNIKAVVSSGYSFDPIMSNYKDYGFVGVIQKPYSADELKNIVTELLTHDK
ncbi:MAG TPA: response regulator, partial [Verrucomicrobiota bacterium]|nr:response regulator [Verrucomicrobiota bacterium]